MVQGGVAAVAAGDLQQTEIGSQGTLAASAATIEPGNVVDENLFGNPAPDAVLPATPRDDGKSDETDQV